MNPLLHSRELLMTVDIAFRICVLACFVRVCFAAKQAGGLSGGISAPPPFPLSGPRGWFFILGVLVLLFVQSPFYIVLVAFGLTMFLRESRRTAREQFGFDRMPLLRVVKWSLLVCGAVIFIELPLSRAVDWAMNTAHLPHPEQESIEIFRRIDRPAEILAFLAQAIVLSPLIEELFFRGFLFPFLKNYASTGLALVLSAGVFAFAHANLGSVLQLWVLGLVLGLAYEHSGSLLLPIGIHACWNFLTAISLLIEKGGS